MVELMILFFRILICFFKFTKYLIMLLRPLHQFFLFFALLLCLNACSLFTPHKMDINQGVQIEQSALDKLKLGMTKEQVEFVLGSPATQNLYTLGRWDYVESIKSDNQKNNVNKKLALWFDGNSLERVAASGYNVSHLQGKHAVRIAQKEPKRTIPTPQPISPLTTTTPAPTPISIEKEIQDTLDIWSSAWSNQDVNAYVTQYVQGYSPSKSLKHSTWVKRKKSSLVNPKFIKLKLSNLQINVRNNQQATAQFVQSYQSNTYQDTVIKKLTFTKEHGLWKIAKEQTLKKLK